MGPRAPTNPQPGPDPDTYTYKCEAPLDLSGPITRLKLTNKRRNQPEDVRSFARSAMTRLANELRAKRNRKTRVRFETIWKIWNCRRCLFRKNKINNAPRLYVRVPLYKPVTIPRCILETEVEVAPMIVD